jgi:hypothetical protein
MNPLDDPAQRDAYLAQARADAQRMADEARAARQAAVKAQPPRDRCSPVIVGVQGPADGMQAVDG